jgi:gamma-glutamyltranspeptidase/glutathione hydrolase
MTPTMVTRGGKLVLITGSPGGRTIINTVLSVVLGVTEFGMDVRAAVDAPRMHHQWLPETVSLEEKTASKEVQKTLTAMGYTLKPVNSQGDANSILIDASGVAWGANDRRSPDGKVSVR